MVSVIRRSAIGIEFGGKACVAATLFSHVAMREVGPATTRRSPCEAVGPLPAPERLSGGPRAGGPRAPADAHGAAPEGVVPRSARRRCRDARAGPRSARAVVHVLMHRRSMGRRDMAKKQVKAKKKR